ncbi:MAG: hypothetical protein ACKPBB_09065 [Sphaerospermopsis kisseleviana]
MLGFLASTQPTESNNYIPVPNHQSPVPSPQSPKIWNLKTFALISKKP